MSAADEEKLRKEIDYWRCEALIAEEQRDEEQARKYLEWAEELQRRLATLTATRPNRIPR